VVLGATAHPSLWAVEDHVQSMEVAVDHVQSMEVNEIQRWRGTLTVAVAAMIGA
jgi:hypothetical protein